MRRFFSLFALAAPTLLAQFSDFAVTDDGRLFFTTPLSTGDEDMRTKVYRVDSSGVSLYATGGEPAVYGPIFIGPNAITPLTSGDGSIHGYARNYPNCNPRCSAFVLPRTTFTLNGVEGFSSFGYDFLQVSRNARFLLGQTSDWRVRRIELPSRDTYEFPQYLVTAGRRVIANSGAVLLRTGDDDSPLLYAPYGEQPRTIPGTVAARSATLSPKGDWVTYFRRNPSSSDLMLTDPQGSSHRLLASAPAEDALQPSFANDGTLLYLNSSGQPMLLAPGAAEPRPLITLDGPAKAAILSGNGQIAWFTTDNGRLIRVRTGDLGIDEFIPPTPDIGTPTFSAAPGSVICVFGSGLSERARFSLAGQFLPYSELSPRRAAVQIPWEFPVPQDAQFLRIETDGHPFHQVAIFYPLAQPAVNFERGSAPGDLTLQAAHQDFRGVISSSDPARPGETIHVFARNLGPVDQPVATGQPSPTSPPARITTPLTCTLSATGEVNPSPRIEPLVVPFAGLSGGAVGIYQIDVTIPADWNSNEALLRCAIDFRADAERIAIAALP